MGAFIRSAVFQAWDFQRDTSEKGGELGWEGLPARVWAMWQATLQVKGDIMLLKPVNQLR
jgi:hypothetical protein